MVCDSDQVPVLIERGEEGGEEGGEEVGKEGGEEGEERGEEGGEEREERGEEGGEEGGEERGEEGEEEGGKEGGKEGEEGGVEGKEKAVGENEEEMCIATDSEGLIAESKRETENAGTQTKAEAYAILGNRIVDTLQKGEVVDSTIGYGIELRKSGIQLHKVHISFNSSGNISFENSTLYSTTVTAAQALHWIILQASANNAVDKL